MGDVVDRLSWWVVFPSRTRGNEVVSCLFCIPELCAKAGCIYHKLWEGGDE